MAGGAAVTLAALKFAPASITSKLPYGNNLGGLPIYAGVGGLIGFILSRR